MIGLAAKATLAIAIAFAATAVARRARASFRHAIYTALFAFLLLLPLSPLLVPRVNVPVPAPQLTPAGFSVLSGAAAPPPPQPKSRPKLWLPTFTQLYAAGVLILLTSLALGVFRLRKLANEGEVWLEGTCAATVVLSDDVDVPMTFGFIRQTIVFPAAAREWDEDSLRRAMCHELEHVRRNDWLLQLVARAACAIYWPHALVWIAWRRLCVEAERACDDAVVSRFEATTYADQLVTFARTLTRTVQVPALGMVSRTRLSERVYAILDPSQRRGPHGRIASFVTIVMMTACLAVFGSVRLVASMSEAPEKSDVNTPIPGDGTPLLIAAKHGDIEMMKSLFERGADPNVPSPGDGNALIAAAGAGQVEAVKLLLDRGARIDEVVPGDETALITAAWRGRLDVVRLLIARGADVNLGVEVDTYDGRREYRTPLRMAHRGGHAAVMDALVAAGAREKKSK